MTAPLTNTIPPPPRNIAGGYGFGMWLGRVLAILGLAVGLLIVLFLLLVILWAGFHVEVPGHVTGGDVTRGSKGRLNYSLNYDYQSGGHQYHDHQSVGAGDYMILSPERNHGATNIPTPVTVRHFNLGAIHYSDIKETRSVASVVAIKFSGSLIIIGFIVLLNWIVWITPLRVRWLFINGLSAPAAVIDKRSQRNKNTTTYLATIVYEHPITHERFEREVTVRNKVYWDAAETGLIVNVLCHPRKPKRIAVAEWGPYRIIN